MATKDPFLPDDYEVPKKPGKFLKFQKGENRIRILASPLRGYVAWKTVDGKKAPIRRLVDDFKPEEYDKKDGSPKHFWAMPVLDWSSGQVKVLEITQSTIQTAIKNLATSKKWGHPSDYDIVVTATGEGMEREYSVIPEPKEPLNALAKSAWSEVERTFDILRLLTNGDPFGGDGEAGNGHANPADDDIPF